MPIPKSAYVSDVWRDGIFDNKVVFCTGGAGTICSAQVRAMVHLGANACIIGRNAEKTENMARDIETARSGSKVLGLGNVDVSQIEDLEGAVKKCVDKFGRIDFVIAGAAGNFLASINHVSSNAFRRVMEIDTLGSWNTVKATLPYLVKSAAAHPNDGKSDTAKGTGGRIIFISATFPYRGAVPLQVHASAAKAGVDAIAHGVAVEQGPLGITSNIIVPGPIAETEGVARLLAGERRESEKQIPLGRYGLTKEIADATIYLFSDAGNYVNGEALVVDGGDWRTSIGAGGGNLKYPDFLLSGEEVTGVKGGKKSKL